MFTHHISTVLRTVIRESVFFAVRVLSFIYLGLMGREGHRLLSRLMRFRYTSADARMWAEWLAESPPHPTFLREKGLDVFFHLRPLTRGEKRVRMERIAMDRISHLKAVEATRAYLACGKLAPPQPPVIFFYAWQA